MKLGESESNIDSTAACIFCIHLCKTLRSSGEVQLHVGCAADWLASARPGWLRRGSQLGSPGKVAHGWHLTSHTKNASYNLGISRELRGLGQLKLVSATAEQPPLALRRGLEGSTCCCWTTEALCTRHMAGMWLVAGG